MLILLLDRPMSRSTMMIFSCCVVAWYSSIIAYECPDVDTQIKGALDNLSLIPQIFFKKVEIFIS